MRWVHRSAGEDLVSVVKQANVTTGTWVWLGGEASAVRAVRRHFVDLGVSKKDIEFAGYWRRALTQDDAPTSEDLAEAQERIASLSE